MHDGVGHRYFTLSNLDHNIAHNEGASHPYLHFTICYFKYNAQALYVLEIANNHFTAEYTWFEGLLDH